jgi:hypothetical protein
MDAHSYTPDDDGRCITCGEPHDHPNHNESW